MFTLDAGHQRLSSKRKLDDYGVADDEDDEFADIVTPRMRKFDSVAVNSRTPDPDHGGRPPSPTAAAARVPEAPSSAPSCSASSSRGLRRSASSLQFFVRSMSQGKTLVIQANRDDTVRSLHERIHSITGIPVIEQRLIYMGKQLQWEQSLGECSIQNDAGLQLVGRMRSTGYPLAWKTIDELLALVWELIRCSKELIQKPPIKGKLFEFLKMTPRNDTESAAGHLQILLWSSAPSALVMLYSLPDSYKKDIADEAIRYFINSCSSMLPTPIHYQCAPVVLEFCKLLGTKDHEDALYLLCRSTLGSLVETVGFSRCVSKGSIKNKSTILFEEVLPFVNEIASRLSKDLLLGAESSEHVGPLLGDVRDFSAFLLPLRSAINEHVEFRGPIPVPLHTSAYDHPHYGEEVVFLHVILSDLLKTMDQCLQKMEERLMGKNMGEDEYLRSGWSHYLAILKELNNISRLYEGAEERFWNIIRKRKYSVRALILKYAKRSEDNQWILQHKDVTDFESRRHLVMMLLPETRDDYEDLHEMLIDRSHLLEESFEYIGRADAGALHSGLFMEFKNEVATGPGVLREWFLLVSQAIFNPENALFVACPNDRRRFYPNPASKVDPLHLEYFGFSGRIVALALMHKVQVGILLDRVFFSQLAGRHISLEDIRDADPEMYHSCKKILEMDDEFMDSDELGLTFVTEFEELGSRKLVELCPGGHNMIVNSRNREKYVDLLIQHRFVTSISEQVSHFAQGFADIMCDSRLQRYFFQNIDLEDLDSMLHGSESDINVEDWKKHTEYNGFTKKDRQISWFWEIVGRMSAEQKKVLLFFWTSIKYLPVDGFGGLASRLYIYDSSESRDRLPSSHTCFYRLCFPRYPSMAVMQDRFRVVTQEHVGCSFGTW